MNDNSLTYQLSRSINSVIHNYHGTRTIAMLLIIALLLLSMSPGIAKAQEQSQGLTTLSDVKTQVEVQPEAQQEQRNNVKQSEVQPQAQQEQRNNVKQSEVQPEVQQEQPKNEKQTEVQIIQSNNSAQSEKPKDQSILGTIEEESQDLGIKKKYMIIIANQKGYYTLYDFNEGQEGNAAIELTPKDDIMVPLKRLVKLIPGITYRYDTKKKSAIVENINTGKRVVYKKNSKTLNYYSGPKAKAAKKTMPYKMYVSDSTNSVMVPMNTLKWLFQTTKGHTFYQPAEMQKLGYDTMEYDGLIIYNPYQAIASVPKAANVTGISLTVKVTIPEGYAVAQIFELLVKKGVCSSTEELYEVMDNYDFSSYPLISELEGNENRSFLLEGYLFPDTYEFYRLSKPENILGKLLANTELKLKEDYRAKAKELGYTMDEILTIASMIEKETADPKLMPMIASVIYNRLKINMKLQFDSSIYYVERYVKPFISGDIDRYNGYYNTYKCPALPEGPISNPGMKAIQAALNPADTEYLFFYSDKNSEYHFSVEYVNSRLLEQEQEKEKQKSQENQESQENPTGQDMTTK